MITFLTSVLSGTFAGLAVVFLGKTWIKARIEASIKHEYDRILEEFKRELDRKEKIELVSLLLAEWIKHPKGEPIPKEQRTTLNKLSFQASLWLPSELAIELAKTIQNQKGAKQFTEIVLLARKVLDVEREDSLTLEHITFWKPELETVGDPIIQMPPA